VVARDRGHGLASQSTIPRDRDQLAGGLADPEGNRPVIEFTLGRCPFAEVAAADPDTICRLHLGLAEGLTEGLGGLITERLTVRPARRAGCRLTVRRATAEARISA
jgi:hypothetical protein